jgi:mRNA-degrading endonuclease RelE of RelBE toxin-antitoxin system
MYSYILHEAVKADYDEAYAWYEEKMQGLGERFLSAIRTKLDEIAKRPEAFGVRSKKGYREAKIDTFPYSIVYKIYKTERIIFVNSVHHHKKHPRKKYRKR